MNLLFTFVSAVLTTLVVLGVTLILVTAIESLTGKKFKPKWRYAGLLAPVFVVILTANGLTSFTPKLELEATALPTAPEVVAVPVSPPLVEQVDRKGLFEKRIEAEPVE